jgi:hypothetical protein
MNNSVPDAWDDQWSSVADVGPEHRTHVPRDLTLCQTTPSSSASSANKKVSSKVSKAQKRAQQAEFNRQLWAEAYGHQVLDARSAMLTSSREGPRETNYFLESRNTVPLQTDYKPPPVLLSRKGPPIVSSARPANHGLSTNDTNDKAESSEDEEEVKAREQTLAERKAQAAKEREEKQRKYDERRQELFGKASAGGAGNTARPNSQSGTSTPNSLTPPGSRSATPNRGRGRGRGRGATISHAQQGRLQQRQPALFDPSYTAEPESIFVQRQQGSLSPLPPKEQPQKPIREPRGPDGSGRGGFGFSTTRESRYMTDLANNMAESVLGP